MLAGFKIMMLSDKTIREYIDSGKILILPEFEVKNIRPAGVRMHLGSELLVPKENKVVDFEGSAEELFDKVIIPEQGYVLKPGAFVLGSTYERFQVPRNVVCHIEGRSTMARLGMAIHCTSGIVDGNYEEPKTVVLEIKNQSPFDLVLKFKLAVAMVTFSELTSDINQAAQHQYKGQSGVVAPNLKLQKE